MFLNRRLLLQPFAECDRCFRALVDAIEDVGHSQLVTEVERCYASVDKIREIVLGKEKWLTENEVREKVNRKIWLTIKDDAAFSEFQFKKTLKLIKKSKDFFRMIRKVEGKKFLYAESLVKIIVQIMQIPSEYIISKSGLERSTYYKKLNELGILAFNEEIDFSSSYPKLADFYRNNFSIENGKLYKKTKKKEVFKFNAQLSNEVISALRGHC